MAGRRDGKVGRVNIFTWEAPNVNCYGTRKTDSRTNTLHRSHMAHTATPTAHTTDTTRDEPTYQPSVLLLSTLVVVSTCRVYPTL